MGWEPKQFLISALVALLMVTYTTIHGQSNAVQFVDITVPAGITFKHVYSPEKKYIVESMSGGVALFDYDNDGYLDIFLVNSLTVELLKSNKRTRSALYHNNGDGTFTDVTDKARVADIGWGMGVAVGAFNQQRFHGPFLNSTSSHPTLKKKSQSHLSKTTFTNSPCDPPWSTRAA